MSARNRILREIKEVYHLCCNDEYKGLRILETERERDSLYSWSFLMKGPVGSPYEGGIWQILMFIPSSYPANPPYMRFEDPIIHPNVSIENGEVCIDIIKEKWNPSLSIRTALDGVQAIMYEPNAFSPLNIDASNLLKTDEKAFANVVRYHAKEYANLKKWDKQTELIDSLFE